MIRQSLLLFLAILGLSGLYVGFAQDGTTDQTPAPTERAQAESAPSDSERGIGDDASADDSSSDTVPASQRTPRATMMGFLDAINDVARGRTRRLDDAVQYLDLSEIHPSVRDTKGPELAIQLKDVIDRTRYVSAEEIPDSRTGSKYVFLLRREGRVVIAQGDDGAWRFDTETVASIPELTRALEDTQRVEGVTAAPREVSLALRLREAMPPQLREKDFLLENWQWLGLFLLIFVGFLADRVVVFLLRGSLSRFLHQRRVTVAAEIVSSALRPFGLLAMAVIWWSGLNALGLPPQVLVIAALAVRFLAAACGVWAAYKAIDVLGEYFMARAEGTESKLDDILVPLLSKSSKVFVSAFGVIFIADNLNVNITSLLAGLGLGGLAFALAAQDTVKNLFGSLTVLFDRPFNVGDWVKIGDQEGTVTEIGFRSTRIRTFYDSMITIPNSNLIASPVDNLGARRYRRWKTTLSVTYGTPPERLEAFCEGVRELVRLHPYTRKDYFHVYVNEFGASSLDVLLYVFHETPDWSTELRERHRLFLDILRLAKRLGVEFAFPTRTLWMHQAETIAQPEPAPAGSRSDVDARIGEGRERASDISEAFGPGDDRPPPVSFP